MSGTYISSGQDANFGQIDNRFFYGIRRTDEGELFLVKVDQTKKGQSIVINEGDVSAENFQAFEVGQDFFEGRDVFHELVYETLKYEQFKWDNRDMLFYIDDDGYFTIKVNEKHDYDETVSSNG
jgi:hypothetical protein